jgi:hypothetical protein
MDLKPIAADLERIRISASAASLIDLEAMLEPWERAGLIATPADALALVRRARQAAVEDGRLPRYPSDLVKHLHALRQSEEDLRRQPTPPVIGAAQDKHSPESWARFQDAFRAALVEPGRRLLAELREAGHVDHLVTLALAEHCRPADGQTEPRCHPMVYLDAVRLLGRPSKGALTSVFPYADPAALDYAIRSGEWSWPRWSRSEVPARVTETEPEPDAEPEPVAVSDGDEEDCPW